MPSQHGQIPQFKIGNYFPGAVKIVPNASILYGTTGGGLPHPLGPVFTFGLQQNAALANGTSLILATGITNMITVINKVIVRTSVTGKYGLAADGVLKYSFYLETNKYQEIDLGPLGSVDFCISNGTQLRLYNFTGGAVDIDGVALGNQCLLQP